MAEDPPPVKPRRYDSASRRAASARTRQRVLDVARELFVCDGYRSTTIGRIASGAAVNADTVYALVGRKPVVLRELIEQALSGTDHAVPAEERPAIVAVMAEPDPVVKLRRYAAVMVETHQRLAPLFLAARDAASTDPDAAAVWHGIAERRATNMRRLAGELHATGRLRHDLTVDAAADIIWATNSPELWVPLTADRNWSPTRYEHWLADTWIRVLLDEVPAQLDRRPASSRTITRLILLNGPPASGKSTLAARFVAAHPLALNLDIDVVRGLLGRWADSPSDAGALARAMALGMARTALESGHDVIVPQLLARPQLLDELERLAAVVGARFVEVALMAERTEMHRWFDARSTAPTSATHRDAQVLVDRLGGPAALDDIYDGVVRLVDSRPRTRRIPARVGDIDASSAELERVLADDAPE